MFTCAVNPDFSPKPASTAVKSVGASAIRCQLGCAPSSMLSSTQNIGARRVNSRSKTARFLVGFGCVVLLASAVLHSFAYTKLSPTVSLRKSLLPRLERYADALADLRKK